MQKSRSMKKLLKGSCRLAVSCPWAILTFGYTDSALFSTYDYIINLVYAQTSTLSGWILIFVWASEYHPETVWAETVWGISKLKQNGWRDLQTLKPWFCSSVQTNILWLTFAQFFNKEFSNKKSPTYKLSKVENIGSQMLQLINFIGCSS